MIRALARRLDLDDAQAETAGYPTLLAEWESKKAKVKRQK